MQARLDERAQRALEEVARQRGWSRSRVVREALLKLAETSRPPARRQVIGVGRFASGVPDLGSNPERMRGFGR